MSDDRKKMVLLINGSPNANRNTAAALKTMKTVFTARGLQTVWFQLGSKPVRGCIDCERCAQNGHCVFADDLCNDLIEAITQADAVVIGTPVYFAGPNGALCALLDRAFFAMNNAGTLPIGKPAAAVATCQRDGAVVSIDRINKYFTYSQMPIVSSNYWNGYFGEKDTFGVEVLQTLAENMVKMLV